MGSILVPLNDLATIEPLVEAGADEFYVGFYDPAWSSAFGPLVDVNRMSGFGTQANSNMLQHVLLAAQTVKALDKKLFVTFNSATYPMKTMGMIAGMFQMLGAYGVDGVILSGPELVDMALAYNLQPVASTMCGIYNRHIAEFYRNCGVTRMILPRDMSVAEIESIVQAFPDVEFEVFLMRNGCIFSDSHCLGTHLPGTGALCGDIRRCARVLHTSLPLDDVEENSALYCDEFHAHACGLCALWDFERMGVHSYKIVGRCDDADAIIEDIGTVRRELEIAGHCEAREEFLDAMAPHPYASIVCNRKLNCYYPDVSRA